MNATSKSIYTGFYTTLKVNGGTGKITWSSSNKNIATVNSSGRVVGKKAGTAYIYAKRNGYTTKCKVSVKENAKSYNVSTNVFDYDRGEPSVAVRKVYYSGGAFYIKAQQKIKDKTIPKEDIYNEKKYWANVGN